MSNHVPTNNGTCPCKRCQAVLGLGPRAKEMRRRRKIITHHIEQVARMRGTK